MSVLGQQTHQGLDASRLSRRRFIGLLGAGTAAVTGAVTGAAFPAFADHHELLPDREGAARLMLHYNENSLGMSPKAVKAAQQVVAAAPNRYADDEILELTDMLAARHGVPADWIVMGNGSTEILKSVITMAANSGYTLVEPTPTFGAARGYASVERMPVITVPVNADFTTNLGALKAAADKIGGPVLINICAPNNPTGTICDHEELLAWITNAPDDQLFLLDEAYVDYALLNPKYRSLLPLVKEGAENIIVARTFSKVYGMAGMRVGYGVAARRTMAKLKPFTASYNLSAAGVAAAKASLSDTEFYDRSLKSNSEAKAILINALNELGLGYIPSSTNFLLQRIGGPLEDYQRRMNANGILVGRRMTKEDGWNRLSIGTPAEMRAFTTTLRAFREKGWA